MAYTEVVDSPTSISDRDPEVSYALTDLSNCRPDPSELQPSNVSAFLTLKNQFQFNPIGIRCSFVDALRDVITVGSVTSLRAFIELVVDVTAHGLDFREFLCSLSTKYAQTWARHYANELFAEMDFERPSTSEFHNNGYVTEHPDGLDNGVYGDQGDIYQYYYMVEDSHEDVLKKEIEEGSKDFVHIRELEMQKENHVKVSNEKRKEKERIIELRRQLAIENRNLQLFCCFVCSKVFTEEENMRQHVSEKHLAFKKVYYNAVNLFDGRFKFGHHLRRHEDTHKHITFMCLHCNREFREEISLQIHLSKVHNVSLDGKKLSKTHRCECGKTFGLKEELSRHRYYCGNKEKIAEQRRRARQELDAMSSVSSARSVSSCSDTASTPSLGSASGRPIKDKSCPFCFLVCASMQSRRRHIERKHRDKLGEVEVDQHQYIKVNSASLPYACDVCSKAFASHASLSTHKKRIHEDMNNHECVTCGRRYPLASELRKHIKRVHEKRSKENVSEL
uniref:C2H2-type domain-containing protein n=1 Tax=Angiostrongylus cantonensis TaxID=6313 RepID=A0A0K0DCJ7_ANGCA